MPTQDMPWWLLDIDIIGFEGEDDSDDDDDGEDGSEEEEDEGSSGGSDEDEDDQDDDEEEEDPTEGLKSALRKERMARKKAERELKKLKSSSTKPTPKPKENEGEDEDQSSEELEAERSKSERLARRLRDQAIDTLVLKHAKNFADPDDAVRLVNRSLIEIDQDDDDPSEIEVDEDSVKDAVKALAKQKKHLLASNAGNSTKSGSKFGGKKGGKKKEISDEELRRKYAALRR